MEDNEFLKLLEIESKKLDLYFKMAKIEGKGTPQEVSDRTENVVKQFFEKYFPFPFRITKGNIIDSYGNRSDSIDCIILNPSHPNTIDKINEKSSVIFADAVDYAIEVKGELNDKEIKRAIEQIISVKKLERRKAHLYSGVGDEQLHKKIPSLVFCENTLKDKELLINKILDYYHSKNIDRSLYFDIIAVNNDCLILNSNVNAQVHVKGDKIVLYESKGRTLAFLLCLMSWYPLSVPRIVEDITKYYLDKMLFTDVKYTPYSP